ncbi:MAG: murein biosynthesis integral membrane protein MurJ [Thermodesulfovibrio sp.]|nr:murein biosynthesis integral membrane protein MurJ [Thermodesulfovibrio sp.]
MSFATLISRILGYVKDMILAKFFGATGTSDIFFVAFRIPNLLRELFAEGSMSSAFIPVLTEYQTKHGKEEANRLVKVTFFFILIFVGLICTLGIIFAPAIVSVIAPGFLSDSVKFANTVLLTRIMVPFLLFISLAALTMGALNTRGAFFIPALAPAALNIVIIISVLTLSIQFTQPIVAVAIGVTVGGLTQFMFQVPAFFRRGYSFFRSQKLEQNPSPIMHHSSLPFMHPGLKKIGILIIPATAGLAVAQINIFVSTILASYLAEGSITYLYYSMRLIQFPIGIFGVAMGMAVLPALSEHAVKKEFDILKEDFSFALRLLFFITVPAMIGLIALKVPIVNVLFQRGEFDYAATIGTSDALMFYSIGIWAIVGVRVITATFYSMQDTKTPVKIAVVAMIANIIFSLLLMSPMKHNGLALANSIASGANFILLFYFLRKKLGGVGTKRIAVSFAKTLTASVVMGFAGWYILQGKIWIVSGNSLEKALYLGITMLLCIGIFMFISYLLKSEEMGYILKKVRSEK